MPVHKKKAKAPVKTATLSRSVHQQTHQVVVEFFGNHTLHEADEQLWQWLTEALSREHSIYNSAKERANLIFFYENIKKLLHSLRHLNDTETNKRP